MTENYEGTNGWDESKKLIRHRLDTNDKAHNEIKDDLAAGFSKVNSDMRGITGKLSSLGDTLNEMRIADTKSRTETCANIKALETRISRMEKVVATVSTGIVLWVINQVLNLI